MITLCTSQGDPEVLEPTEIASACLFKSTSVRLSTGSMISMARARAKAIGQEDSPVGGFSGLTSWSSYVPKPIPFTPNKSNSRQKQCLWHEDALKHRAQGCIYDVLGGRQHADPFPASTATSVDNGCESWWCHSKMSLISLTPRIVPKGHFQIMKMRCHCKATDYQICNDAAKGRMTFPLSHKASSVDSRHTGKVWQDQICVPILWLCWSSCCCTAAAKSFLYCLR